MTKEDIAKSDVELVAASVGVIGAEFEWGDEDASATVRWTKDGRAVCATSSGHGNLVVVVVFADGRSGLAEKYPIGPAAIKRVSELVRKLDW